MNDTEDTRDLSAFNRDGVRGQTLVLGDGETRNEVQINGRWIRTREPADLGAWR